MHAQAPHLCGNTPLICSMSSTAFMEGMDLTVASPGAGAASAGASARTSTDRCRGLALLNAGR
jgi:hypothetical protein